MLIILCFYNFSFVILLIIPYTLYNDLKLNIALVVLRCDALQGVLHGSRVLVDRQIFLSRSLARLLHVSTSLNFFEIKWIWNDFENVNLFFLDFFFLLVCQEVWIDDGGHLVSGNIENLRRVSRNFGIHSLKFNLILI